MLTKADDYPVHQTPDPIAHPGTDRNFYDRFFFCGWSPDGGTYVLAAMGLYPNLDIIDAAFAISHNGVQHSVFASRILHSERLDLQVGPIRVEIVEPLARMRLSIAPNETGVTADLLFTSILPPVEEERHRMRHGPRTIFELTRMSIFGDYDGWAQIGEDRIPLAGFQGMRDRSWGVRNIGARDPQPLVPAVAHEALWIWTPFIFGDRAFLFVELDGPDGRVIKRRAEIITAEGVESLTDCTFDATFDATTKRATTVRITGRSARDGLVVVESEPGWTFPLVGIGYDHPVWMHGSYQGPLAVHGEQRVLASLDPLARENIHVHASSGATMTFADGRRLVGRGAVEQLIFGSHPFEGLRT